MPDTRGSVRSDEVLKLIEEKFDELKESFFKDAKNQIVSEITEILKPIIEDKNQEIVKLSSTVSMLQNQVTELKQQNIIFSHQVDNVEQYGLPKEDNETADEVFNKVVDIINATEVQIPKDNIDRAHRISKIVYDKKTNKKFQSVIVRFTSFRHRTYLYRTRKNIKYVKIKIDLTQRRFKLMLDANEIVKEHPVAKFAYPDINCRLKIHLNEVDDKFFSSLEELEEILKKL